MSRLKQGTIYNLYDDGIGKERPVLVVSREELNGGDSVVTVPFYSQQLDKRTSLPFCALFHAGSAGLDRACVAKADEIRVTEKTEINIAKGPIGVISKSQLSRVLQAIDHVLGR